MSDHVGHIYGYLRVEEMLDRGRVRCTCIRCGGEKRAYMYNLIKGLTLSCGCLRRDKMAEIGRQNRGRCRDGIGDSVTEKILHDVAESQAGLSRQEILQKYGESLTAGSFRTILWGLVRDGRLRRVDGRYLVGQSRDGARAMTTYQIESKISGTVLGTWEAASEQEALDAMARDAGYDSYEALQEVASAKDGEIRVTAVD